MKMNLLAVEATRRGTRTHDFVRNLKNLEATNFNFFFLHRETGIRRNRTEKETSNSRFSDFDLQEISSKVGTEETENCFILRHKTSSETLGTTAGPKK